MGEKLWNSWTVSEWHEQLKEGCGNVKDDRRSGCPRFYRTDENVEKVQNLVHSYRYLSIRAMAVQPNLDKQFCA
jgi:hypothetical protein